MKEKILFKCYSGSKLYGTDNENSDTDIKGVFLPDINDLILGKAPKHYQFTTGSKNERNSKEDIDECYYSLHYFLELLSKGDTNALDLFFAYTNYEKVIIDTPEWLEIIENKDKLLTKNMKAYLSYAKSQCIKYSIKGDKLNNFLMFKTFCEKYFDRKNENGESETLFNCLNTEYSNSDYPNIMNKVIIPNPGERVKIGFNEDTEFNFGGHCYIETASNKEIYLTISDVKFQIYDSIKSSFAKINKVIASYGKRAENAAKNNGVDYKAISHAVRVALQVEDILYYGYIRFPLKDAQFVKSIKYKTTKLSYDEIMDWLNRKIEYIEKELLPKSRLREKSDFDWIENFILKQYRK